MSVPQVAQVNASVFEPAPRGVEDFDGAIKALRTEIAFLRAQEPSPVRAVQIAKLQLNIQTLEDISTIVNNQLLSKEGN
jgi:hypothetical protein